MTRMSSAELVDSILEDNFATLMNQTVDYACESENSTDDRAHVDEELEEVLACVRIPNGERRHFIVENNHVFI